MESGSAVAEAVAPAGGSGETGEDRVRMFVALDLPEAVEELIQRWGEEALSDPLLRPVEPDSLHLTLAFLGERALAEVERIEAAMWEIADVCIMLELGEPVWLPRQGRPRVLALPTDSNPVIARRAELVELLAMDGIRLPDEREFLPHVTVARVRRGEGSRRPAVPLGGHPTGSYGWFDAVRVSLYRSDLQPQGARYVPLAQVELPGRGWQ